MNESGIHPVEYRVLVKPHDIEETDPQLKSAKLAGLVLPEKERDRERMAQVDALLVEASEMAFQDWSGRKPQAGDTVVIRKYEGIERLGKDGVKYRILNDKDILAVVD